ncbi:MAG TPA: hypothetical protein PK867_24890 [Pirellulales bacterium]|nr:hypothetical protein [Pirellulales bacterium]
MLWQELPVANQQRALQTLSRMLAQRLPTSPTTNEVTYEQK